MDSIQEWIIKNSQDGKSVDWLLKEMLGVGWDENHAIQTMQQTMVDVFNKNAPEKDLPEPSPVPIISLEGSPNTVDAGDRIVEIVASIIHPRVVVVADFLSDEECDYIISNAESRIQRSSTLNSGTGESEVHPARTSFGMFYKKGENEVIQRIEQRIAKLTNWPAENGEGLQVLRYQVGQEYVPHNDYFDTANPNLDKVLARGGQRVGTFLMYLNNPIRGGGTSFPDVGFEVAPKKGSAVFFSYDRPHKSTKTLHAGTPVQEGEKWVATKWLRQREFI